MPLQDLSYLPKNDSFLFFGYDASLRLIGFENLFTLAPGSMKARGPDLASRSIIWGDDMPIGGEAGVRFENDGIVLFSDTEEPIRALQLRLEGLPSGKIASLISGKKEIAEDGLLYRYPEGWRSLSHPLFVIEKDDGGYLYFAVRMKEVMPVSFYVRQEEAGVRLDITVEQIASKIADKFETPLIEAGTADSLEEIAKRQAAFMKEAYGIETLQSTHLAPPWFKGIDLVVTMHMESYTGKIFHTYRSALEDLEALSELIEPKRILVYLAGWEGRYYWKYGDYTPDERLGGSKGLKELVDGVHRLGAKAMAMYGMNVASDRFPEIDALYEKACFVTPSGGRSRQGSVDWEGGHHYDSGHLLSLNIGCPEWQDYFFKQIENSVKEYGFDGAFLDIAAGYTNDARNRVDLGVRQLCDRLRSIKPDFLVAGEGFYDYLASCMPLFQSGHTDGLLHYHDSVSESLFTPYAREFAHLCLGDPSEGSTGVHEQGHIPEYKVPVRKGIIPTLSLVDGSLEKGRDKVFEIIAQADIYRRLQDE